MKTKKERSKAAAELGRRGGLKGGAARAAALTPERRREIARKAISARWGMPREQIISDDTKPMLPGKVFVSVRLEIEKFPQVLGASTTIDRAIARCHQVTGSQEYELQVVEVAVDDEDVRPRKVWPRT